ncbi:MAG: hypothetical protein M0P31_16840 [Solirubrobacteraceae bacterium]|nr:hypothetical protein [Solirubrobacteraceae bacterium]
MPITEQLEPHADFDEQGTRSPFSRTGIPIIVGILLVAMIVLLVAGEPIVAVVVAIAVAGVVIASRLGRAMSVSEQDRRDEQDRRRHARRTGDWS